MPVKYKPQAMEGERTEENQMLLLAQRAYRVWDLWCESDGNAGYLRDIVGHDEKFDNAVRALYRQVRETDVFYSGKHAKK